MTEYTIEVQANSRSVYDGEQYMGEVMLDEPGTYAIRLDMPKVTYETARKIREFVRSLEG